MRGSSSASCTSASFACCAARLAQGFWSSAASGRGQDDGGRGVQTGAPGGMHRQRQSPGPGAQPAADDLFFDTQRRRSAPLLRRRGAVGQERLPCYADRRQRELCTQMERQPGAAWMVSAGGVDEQDLGTLWKSQHSLFHQGPLTEGEQAWLVRGRSFTPGDLDRTQPAVNHQHCSGPAWISDCAFPLAPFRMTDPATGHRAHRVADDPWLWGHGGESVLQPDEFFWSVGPGCDFERHGSATLLPDRE